MTPLLLVASISTLLLTNAPLPARRLSWVNKIFAHVRRFRIMDAEHGVAIQKKNQFGVGHPDFNLMSIWLILIPGTLLFCTYIHHTLHHARDPEKLPEGVTVRQRSVEYVSYTAGWAGSVILSFFLIPVSRHSVLLVAMNWSPVHALRIHIWAGYFAFFFIFLHSIMIVGVWFKWAPGAMYKEFIPQKDCWSGTVAEESPCSYQYFNFTGLIAMIFYIILWASSFNWFRRKWYRLFYILHVVFGTLTLLASISHVKFIGLYLLPSILYYLASTMPTLVQALASRFRGGVQIKQIVFLDDAGKCFEVRMSMEPTAEASLSSTHPNKFIKLCAPGISVVWHPFTVYNHPNDPTTMRTMIRPLGTFTKALRSSMVASENQPLVLIDGFYRGDNYCQQAIMVHDHVSIVAGGVGLTPFISTIFAILKELLLTQSLESIGSITAKDQQLLRSMTLIWSCREVGLLSFVKENYFMDMVRLASGIEDFEFEIKIYCTNKILATFASNTQSTNHLDDVSLQSTEGVKYNLDAPYNHQTISYMVGNAGRTIQTGHTMELGRMMPARHARIIWNVPYFLVFTSTVWIGFHLMLYQYNATSTYRELSKEMINTMLIVVFFFSVGVLTETCVLLCRKKWPAPRTDVIASTVDMFSDMISREEEISAITSEDSTQLSDSILICIGRPSSDDMLADASRAAAPGIFVCGPVDMVKTLRAAVGIENSAFGLLTRYAIYEESFEM